MADDETILEDEDTTVEQGADAPSAPELKVPEPPVVPPPLTTEFHEHEGPRWPHIIGFLVAALIVAFLVVLAARAIYRHYHHSKPAKPPVNQPSQPVSSYEKPHKTTKPRTSHPTTQVVPNTGPGDTLALFAGISLAAAGLHYVVSLRRSAKQN